MKRLGVSHLIVLALLAVSVWTASSGADAHNLVSKAHGADGGSVTKLPPDDYDEFDLTLERRPPIIVADPTPLPTPVPPTPVILPAKVTRLVIVGTHELLWPVNGKITTYFWSGHRAIDISAAMGTLVASSGVGIVLFAGWQDNGGGLGIMVDHGNGTQTTYDHLGSIGVTAGDLVSPGQPIGGVGCSGICTGPHLHFAVMTNGTYDDPLRYL